MDREQKDVAITVLCSAIVVGAILYSEWSMRKLDRQIMEGYKRMEEGNRLIETGLSIPTQ